MARAKVRPSAKLTQKIDLKSFAISVDILDRRLHKRLAGGLGSRKDWDFPPKEENMLWLIFWILLAMWLLGMVTSYTLGGFLHILLVLAVVAVLIRVIQGRNPV
jgi:uncharacterized protein DUF5670